jgi:hypothetical protein
MKNKLGTNPRRILERVIDEVLSERAMAGDSTIRRAIERGEAKWMPGHLIRRLSPEEREAISLLKPEDVSSMRVDPWAI